MIDLIAIGLKLLDKLIPDPVAKDAAKVRLLELAQAGELAELQAQSARDVKQAEVNAVEAASLDPFVRRWRPAIGWICALGLLYQFLGDPLLAWISPMLSTSPPPRLDGATLSTLLAGMLGLSGLRTYEKTRP